MASNATLPEQQVFIASPGDADKYVVHVEAAVDTWNRLLAKSFGVLLRAVRWSRDMPPLLNRGRVQEQINQQLLEPADIVVALFSRDLGDGTAEEIEVARKNKQVLIFKDDAEPSTDLRNYFLQLGGYHVLPK